jgi:Tol biopolymer transport system component
MSRTAFIYRTLLSVGVSAVLVGLLLRLPFDGAGEDMLPSFLEVLRNVSAPLVACYALLALVQAWARAVRYRWLIRASGAGEAPSGFHTMLVTLTRNMLVDLLPARTGELSYIAMMNRGYRVPGRACLSSLSISFLFDLAALAALLAVLAAWRLAGADGVGGWMWAVIGVLCAVCAAGAWCLFSGLAAGTGLLRRMAAGRRAPPHWVERGLVFLQELADALAFTRRSGILLRVFALSLAVRAAKYAGLAGLYYGVTRASFPELSSAQPLAIIVALLSAEAGASMPLPAFMSFGTYEAGGLLALTLLGFSAGASRLAMLAMHVCSQGVDYLLGGAGLVLFIFLVRGAGAAAPQRLKRIRPRTWLAAAAVLLPAIGLLTAAVQYRRLQKQGALAPPPSGAAADFSPAQAAAAHKALAGLRGFMVWSSNRHGNHDILLMRLPERSIRRLTRHPHVDTFPRISPDGRRIVFCRSRSSWVSQRNPRPWDVMLLDLATGTETVAATNAYTPGWSSDGQQIHFVRQGSRVVALTLSNRVQRVLFESGRGGIPANCELQTPDYHAARGALAVTLRGRRRATAVYASGGGRLARAGGCQLTWSPGGDFLYFVDKGGRGGNAFWRLDPDNGQMELWADMPEPFTHEYFPRLSADGRWMVFGASAGAHEHDTADYEIFLWAVDRPTDTAIRLTWHTGNDCWPDLFLETR